MIAKKTEAAKPRRVYFEERRNDKLGWYIGTVIAQKSLLRHEASIFVPPRDFADVKLLILTSDRRKIIRWQSLTFEVENG